MAMDYVGYSLEHYHSVCHRHFSFKVSCFILDIFWNWIRLFARSQFRSLVFWKEFITFTSFTETLNLRISLFPRMVKVLYTLLIMDWVKDMSMIKGDTFLELPTRDLGGLWDMLQSTCIKELRIRGEMILSLWVMFWFIWLKVNSLGKIWRFREKENQSKSPEWRQ